MHPAPSRAEWSRRRRAFLLIRIVISAEHAHSCCYHQVGGHAAACEPIRKVAILARMQGSALAAVCTCRRQSHGLSVAHSATTHWPPPDPQIVTYRFVSRRVKFVPIPSDSQCRKELDQPRAIGEYLSFIFSATCKCQCERMECS